MLYFGYNHKLGEEDAYDRVLDGEHRDVVKKAFIAMVQSSSQLNGKPACSGCTATSNAACT